MKYNTPNNIVKLDFAKGAKKKRATSLVFAPTSTVSNSSDQVGAQRLKKERSALETRVSKIRSSLIPDIIA